MKHIIAILILLSLFLAAPSFSGEGYTFKPKSHSYLISLEPLIEIRIYPRDGDQWKKVIKEYLPDHDPSTIEGLTIRVKNRHKRPEIAKDVANYNYTIFLPRESDGSINLDTLGHEVAHLLEWKWHSERR